MEPVTNLKRIARAPLIVAIVAILPASAIGQTSAERLGYPKGSRVVILDVREMGVAWEINAAGKALVEKGVVTSVDVVAPGPWFYDFAKWARRHRNIDIGVSIALTNPHSGMRWRFLSTCDRQSTLVNADGLPWHDVLPFASNASPEDVAKEIDAQIREARNAGIHLTHISGYYGTVFSRPDLTAVFLAAARKHWLPAPVVELTPEHIARFKKEGFPVEEELIELVRHYALPKLDDIQFVPKSESLAQKRERFRELLRSLRPGLTQIGSRPAVASEGLKMLTDDWQQRVWDYQLLADEKFAEGFREEKIILTNWREIMQRYGARAEE